LTGELEEILKYQSNGKEFEKTFDTTECVYFLITITGLSGPNTGSDNGDKGFTDNSLDLENFPLCLSFTLLTTL
jgi:hypothetical protein